MCCIFTCCGWMIDLVQRLWTFTMACCISSAVCCALVTASMSGIALGYNYSLAEYIDLKETNVSVYLKRGIFDDEIGDDMDWRRSGHQPVAGHIGEANLRTGAPEDESSSIRSGRRLDDSIYESEDRNKFEGSLMKLTAKAPAPSPTPSETTLDVEEAVSQYPLESVDRMKAIQSVINMRKSADSRLRISKEGPMTTQAFVDQRYLPHAPINPKDIAPGRRFMPVAPAAFNTPGDSARMAVPAEPINEPAKWFMPKVRPELFTTSKFGDYDARPNYPAPVTIRQGPVRPTRPKPRPRPTFTEPPTTIGRPDLNYPKSIDEEMDAFKDKLFFDKFNSPRFKEEDIERNIKAQRPDEEDYEEAIKGVPSRKKRHSDFKIPDSIEQKSSLDHPVPNKLVDNSNKNSLFDKIRKSLSDIMSINRNSVTSSTLNLENNTSTISPTISNSISTNIVLRLLKTTTT
ncbi:uncharacterized protein [Epargyreus clarus]|uniref:uncharacterized protein n=1 Tax=Epargyreus clarus TaxID=520877 RepID=UPI003C2AD83D